MTDKNKATIMLFSTDLDKVLTAFIISTGFAAMGTQVTMWFTIWGANCLKRRRGLWHRFLNADTPGEGSQYRRVETDIVLQKLVEMLNRGGPGHLPMSRLHLFGLGPLVFNAILKAKKIPNVEQLVYTAQQLGVRFTVCQMCVDALALDTSDLIVDTAEIKGVSQYLKDVQDAHYNIFI